MPWRARYCCVALSDSTCAWGLWGLGDGLPSQGGLQQRDASSRRAVRARSAVPVRSVGHSRRALQAVAGEKLSVLVTGAGGRTGALVLDKLLSEPDTFTAKGLVRPYPRKRQRWARSPRQLKLRCSYCGPAAVGRSRDRRSHGTLSSLLQLSDSQPRSIRRCGRRTAPRRR
jgi:hypothetical protein